MLSQNLLEKGKSAFWWLNHERLSSLFFLLFLLLPTQLGRHFFPTFSFVHGIRVDYLSPTLYLTDLVTLFFLLVSIYHSSYRDFLRNTLRSHILGIIAFLTIYCLSTLFSQTPLLSLYGVIKLLEFFLLATVLVWYFRKEKKKALHLLTLALSLGVVAESFFAILQYLQQGSLNGILYWLGERYFTAATPGIALASIGGRLLLRPYGTFPHPNVLAAYLVIVQALLLFTKPLSKKTIVVFLLSSTALILTMSRAALLVWFGMLCVYWYGRYPRKWLGGGIIGLVVILLLLPVGQRFLSSGLSDESAQTRIILAKAALQMIQAHLFFGVGLLQFIPSLSSYSLHLSPFLSLQPVHNIFLLLTAELGISGLLLLLLFLIKASKIAYRCWQKQERLPLVLLLLFLFLGSVDHYFYTIQQGQLLSVLLFSLIFSSPSLSFHQGGTSFDSGLRKNTRKHRDYVVDTISSRYQNRKNIRSARTKL